MALLAGEALFVEEKVNHDVLRVECDHVQLVGKNGRLEIKLAADVVEQSELGRHLDIGLLDLLERIDKMVEDGAVVPEHRGPLFIGGAISLIADLDRLRPKRILVDPIPDLCRKTQKRRV
jgi:hypothetical protein